MDRPSHWHHDALPTPPEVLELVLKEFDPYDVALLLKDCWRAKDQDEALYRALLDDLAEIQQAEGLAGLRHERLVFRLRQVQMDNGRTRWIREIKMKETV